MKIYTPPIDLASFVTSSQLSAQFAEKAAGESILPIPQPSDPPAGVIITASSSVGGYGPENAFDGILTGQDFWAHSFTAPTVQSPATLTIEYLEPVFIEGYSIVRYGTATQSPVSWFVETSVDGANWVLRKTVANEPVNSNRINEYWNRPLRPERFIRLTITDVGAFNPGGNFAGVYEFKGIQNPASLLKAGNTHTYYKANHGFPVPSVVAWDGTDWIAADKDTAVDVYIVVSATQDTFTIGLDGSHQVSHGLGGAPGPVYLGDPPNNLTRTAPPAGQTPRRQIILAQVLNSNHLWINPEWRPI